MNGDHVAALEYDPRKVRRAARACPRYGQFHKGKPITTMTYDFWVGRRAQPLRRHALHAPGDLPVEPDELPLRRRARARGRAVVVGRCRRSARSREWANRIELLAMVEDTHRRRASTSCRRRAAACGPTPARWWSGTFSYQLSEQSLRVRELADRAMAQVGERRGLAKFLKLTETQGAYASHPLGGCRMAESADLGVVERPLRGVRQRGAVLHGLLGDPDLAGREPVAHDRRGVRARGGAPHQARRGPRAAARGRRASSTGRPA